MIFSLGTIVYFKRKGRKGSVLWAPAFLKPHAEVSSPKSVCIAFMQSPHHLLPAWNSAFICQSLETIIFVNRDFFWILFVSIHLQSLLGSMKWQNSTYVKNYGYLMLYTQNVNCYLNCSVQPVNFSMWYSNNIQIFQLLSIMCVKIHDKWTEHRIFSVLLVFEKH